MWAYESFPRHLLKNQIQTAHVSRETWMERLMMSIQYLLPLKRIVRRVNRERLSCAMATCSVNVTEYNYTKVGRDQGEHMQRNLTCSQ